jgi:hypothetical protein
MSLWVYLIGRLGGMVIATVSLYLYLYLSLYLYIGSTCCTDVEQVFANRLPGT